jgi:hypothetical protein
MQEADKQQALARITAHLQDLVRYPERTKNAQWIADEQMLVAIRLVVDVLPEDIRQQITEILALHDQVHSPYFRHATEMTSLHRVQEQRSDLPRWIQEEQ